jgi:predicted RNase H-like nuclease (RuvC/YqgF family)
MNFKKKLDHGDINTFLPDNLTVCTSNYFQRKLGEKMPKYISDILELKSRPEHDNENKEKMIDMVKEEYIQEGYNLWKEYEDRLQEYEDQLQEYEDQLQEYEDQLQETESVTPLTNDLLENTN